MKHKDFHKLINLVYIPELSDISNQTELLENGFFVPADEMSEFLNELESGEVISLSVSSARDLKFHKAYFALLSYIYDYLPKRFKSQVNKKYFYRWLQVLKGDYSVVFKYNDGRELIEYNSISFGRMNEQTFRAHIKEQIPYIYEEVISKLFDEDVSDVIIRNTEEEFLKFFTKLMSK